MAPLVTHERRDFMESSAFPSPVLPPVRAAHVQAIPHIIGGLTPIRSPPAIHSFGTPCHEGPHSRAGPARRQSRVSQSSGDADGRVNGKKGSSALSAESPEANSQVQLSARTSCATDNSTSKGDRHAHDSGCACRTILAATAEREAPPAVDDDQHAQSRERGSAPIAAASFSASQVRTYPSIHQHVRSTKCLTTRSKSVSIPRID